MAERLLLVALGIGLVLVVIEVGLRVGRFTLHQIGYRATRPADVEGRAILCVGDSHTYGTSIPREHAYPAQLQTYLDRVDPEGRYTVVNRGVPGINSAQLAHVLPSWLRQYRPDFVVVWVGVNNWWNREDPAQLRTIDVERSALDRALSWSRLYRLWLSFRADSILTEAFDDAETFMKEILRRPPPGLWEDTLSDPEILIATTGDLSFIAEILEDSAQKWILLTYPLKEQVPSGRFAKLHAEAAETVAKAMESRSSTL